jgi:hypothetical protein
VLVGGAFNSVNGNARAYLARLYGGEWPTILARSLRRMAMGEFQFQASGPTNQAWLIQATTNLAAPQWSSILTNILGTGAATVIDADAARNPRRFYRAVLGE